MFCSELTFDFKIKIIYIPVYLLKFNMAKLNEKKIYLNILTNIIFSKNKMKISLY